MRYESGRLPGVAFALALISLAAIALCAGDEGFILRRDAEIAREAPGPHSGKGMSTGYVFFDDVPGFKISFRKRVLHPGASIGYHKQDRDEVYYITGGSGKMTIDGKTFNVKPGDAVLTRIGSSHGLEQTGPGDLTIVITYEK
jgi:mannose-6-phosphate isomerase-like protein (cupin superfamily)